VADARLADAGLAAAALLAVVVAAAALGVRARPVGLVAGVAAAVALEAALQRRHAAVRRAWARPAVKAGAVVAFLAGLGGAAVLAPAAGLSALAGGLVGYLALLSGVAVGDAVGK